MLSERQQPKSVSAQGSTGQPSAPSLGAGDTPSGQHPYSESLQVRGFTQPSSNGPAAAFFLSGQHPNLLVAQVVFFLHLRLPPAIVV